MRVTLLVVSMVATLAFGAPSSAASDGANKFAAAVEQCIRDNAGKVERAVPDLKQGVSFLVDSICAVPVAAENGYKAALNSEHTLASYKAMCDEQKAAAAKKGLEKESDSNAAFDACAMAGVTKIGFVSVAQYGQDGEEDEDAAYIGTGSPKGIALAAKLLLDLRLAHQHP